jgi:hypothetical protein
MAGMEANVCDWIADVKAKSKAAARLKEQRRLAIAVSFGCGSRLTVYSDPSPGNSICLFILFFRFAEIEAAPGSASSV